MEIPAGRCQRTLLWCANGELGGSTPSFGHRPGAASGLLWSVDENGVETGPLKDNDDATSTALMNDSLATGFRRSIDTGFWFVSHQCKRLSTAEVAGLYW